MVSAAERELEEQLIAAGNRILKPPSEVGELLPLLDQVENCLSRVEQSPSESMVNALHSSTQALIAKDLLRHQDMDVRVAVASCISEITRITAPEAPYDDALMKEIFQMIVAAFERLYDMSSPSYAKRVSILETVAKVRSCVVMLDLECDDLILEMFDHFLKGIRESHPENIFTSMETIMSLVVEESEDISSELLHSLLSSVKKENQDILPIARRLGEKVIGTCAAKIKPYLMQEVNSGKINLDDYTKIVTSIYQDTLDARERETLNASGEQLAEEDKLSEMKVSEEPPLVADKVDSIVAYPGEGDKAVVVSNGTGQDAVDNTIDPDSSEKNLEPSHPGHQSEITSAAAEGKSDLTKPETTHDQIMKKTKAQENTSITHSGDTSDHSGLESKKDLVEQSSRKRGRAKEADTSVSKDTTVKGASRLSEGEKRSGISSPTVSHNETVCATSPTPSQSLADNSRRKRGRSNMKKNEGSNEEVDMHVLPPAQKETVSGDRIVDETCPSADNEANKDYESNSDTETKTRRRSSKKVGPRNANMEEKAPATDSSSKKEPDGASDSEVKAPRRPSKKVKGEDANEEETPSKQQGEQPKQRKGTSSTEKGLTREMGKKRTNSAQKSATKKSTKHEILSDETPKTDLKRKRALSGKDSETSHAKDLGEELVGRKIKVWWPDDKMFYDGTVVSFNADTKKHEINYDDGDKEVLKLKKERWEFIDDLPDEKKSRDFSSPDALDMVPKKKMRTSSDSSIKRAKKDSATKRGGASTTEEVKVDGAKLDSMADESASRSRSKSKSDAVKLGSKAREGTPKSGSKSKDKSASKSKELPKTSNKSKDETPKAASKSSDDYVKTSSKVNGSASKGSKVKEGKDSGKRKLTSTSGQDNEAKSGKKIIHESDKKSVKKTSQESVKKTSQESMSKTVKKTAIESEPKSGKKTADSEPKSGKKIADESESKRSKKTGDTEAKGGKKANAEESESSKGGIKSAQKSESKSGKKMAQESEKTSGKKRRGKN